MEVLVPSRMPQMGGEMDDGAPYRYSIMIHRDKEEEEEEKAKLEEEIAELKEKLAEAVLWSSCTRRPIISREAQ
jgi:hypothetical protein